MKNTAQEITLILIDSYQNRRMKRLTNSCKNGGRHCMLRLKRNYYKFQEQSNRLRCHQVVALDERQRLRLSASIFILLSSWCFRSPRWSRMRSDTQKFHADTHGCGCKRRVALGLARDKAIFVRYSWLSEPHWPCHPGPSGVHKYAFLSSTHPRSLKAPETSRKFRPIETFRKGDSVLLYRQNG